MTSIQLPPMISGDTPPVLPASRQVTLVGANGSGKTRFMDELMNRFPGRAFMLSALSAFYPERHKSQLEGSVDVLYDHAVATSAYLKADAMSEFDKLIYMLLNDEFEYLLNLKTNRLMSGTGEEHPTRLDYLIALWEDIFPGNKVLLDSGKLLFATESGSNIISSGRLSQGEKTVLYYIAAALYAMPDAVIFVDSPSIFLHPAILNTLWNAIETLRPDCTFVYNTYDVDFVNSRTENVCVWVKSYDAELRAWDYEVLPGNSLSEDLFIDLIGSRKPVLFIEGDMEHSLDAKLYTLVFSDFTVRPLGSCDKVIECTRTFRDLKYMHHLESRGIVDRDRRTEEEVGYLRRKDILVPDVAEIENIFLLESVVKCMARVRGRDPQQVFRKVKTAVMALWKKHLREQAMMHVRHRVKRLMEYRVDGRFENIGQLEKHLRELPDIIAPRKLYEEVYSEFHRMLVESDYAGVLRVFNHKPMLSESNVAPLLGYSNKDAYISGVLAILKSRSPESQMLRRSVKFSFGIVSEEPQESEFVTFRSHAYPQRRQRPGHSNSATTPKKNRKAKHAK